MHSNMWGGSYWYILHLLSFQTDNDKRKNQYKNIIMNFQKVLPCSVCRLHFRQLINRHPMDMKNVETISRWVYNRHNYLNKLLQKRVKPSYAKAVDMYTKQGIKLQKVKKFFRLFMISLNKKHRVNPYKNIFTAFAHLWPDENIRESLKSEIDTDEFRGINNMSGLKKWFNKNYKKHFFVKNLAIIGVNLSKLKEKNDEKKVHFNMKLTNGNGSNSENKNDGKRTKYVRLVNRYNRINRLIKNEKNVLRKNILKKRKNKVHNNIIRVKKLLG